MRDTNPCRNAAPRLPLVKFMAGVDVLHAFADIEFGRRRLRDVLAVPRTNDGRETEEALMATTPPLTCVVRAGAFDLVSRGRVRSVSAGGASKKGGAGGI